MKVNVSKVLQAGCVILGVAATAGAAHAQSAPAEPVVAARSAPELLVPASTKNLGPACKVAEKFTKLLMDGPREDILDLYAKDAVHYAPDGKNRRTPEEIKEFYLVWQPFKTGTMDYRVVAYVGSGNDCVFELAVAPKDGSFPLAVGAAEHISINKEGKITKFVVFISPPPSMPKMMQMPHR